MAAPDSLSRSEHYLGGAWVQAESSDVFEVRSPVTGELVAEVTMATRDEAERAVQAARGAFAGWAATAPARRAELLLAIADGLDARQEEMAALITAEMGSPIAFSRAAQAPLGAASFRAAAQILADYSFEERLGTSLIVREPVGVVGAITPWNYPLHQVCAKAAYALAAGCTVVVKPSEVAPLSSYLLTEIIDETGLPAGVFNLVVGTGPVVGEVLASHPEVDMVSFTGSTAAGRRVAELAAGTSKRVGLELGGKSASILLPDAELPTAVAGTLGRSFVNGGQTCSALTRMLVPRERLAEVEDLVRARVESLAVGDPDDEHTEIGPMVTSAQRDRVRSYIEIGVAEGGRLVAGGPQAPEGLDRGNFVRPTVFSDVTPEMTIAREEIFGPVLVLLPYDTEDEAVELANSTPYGLSGGVWSGDPERAAAVARRMRTGQVRINGASPDVNSPFGGYKLSGNGRENGPFGFEEFLEVKALVLGE